MKRQERNKQERIKKLTFWEPHVRAWEKSQLGAAAYCRGNNINVSTFTYWRYVIAGKAQSKDLTCLAQSVSSSLFLEVKTVELESATQFRTSLKIETPRGIKIFLESQNLEHDLATILKVSG